MALTVPQGFRVGNTKPVDDRIVFDTVAAALAAVGNPRRYNGLAVWIRDEEKTYRFIGGTTDEHFVPDPASGAAPGTGGAALTWLLD